VHLVQHITGVLLLQLLEKVSSSAFVKGLKDVCGVVRVMLC
jgi:hypothetical protein